MTINDKVSGMLLGLAVGDALGVPVEFMSREQIRRKPVDNMRGYGLDAIPTRWVDSLARLDSINELAVR